ncbi:MAG: hypothetical protein KAW47_07760 [Thermoplasmatales archaeon]|nr:hypothetical protein [Thermoplasmatales archaeon]
MMEDYKKLPCPLLVMSLQVTPFVSYRHACACVEGLIDSGQKAYSVAVNPEKIYKANNDRELADLINSAQVFICDGIGAVLAVRVLHGRPVRRITGVALFYELRRFNKSAVVGGESVAQENLGDGAGEVGFGQEKG